MSSACDPGYDEESWNAPLRNVVQERAIELSADARALEGFSLLSPVMSRSSPKQDDETRSYVVGARARGHRRPPAQAPNLSARAELMRGIAKVVERAKWTQAEAATRAGISQPRMNNLLRGRISNFSMDALVGIADALGQRVSVRLTRASK